MFVSKQVEMWVFLKVEFGSQEDPKSSSLRDVRGELNPYTTESLQKKKPTRMTKY